MSAHRPHRRSVLGWALGGLAGLACRPRERAASEDPVTTSPPRLPVLFVGHGSPMNALDDTPWSRGWRALGEALPTPRAVLVVSAHWYVPYTALTGSARPETIHDFGGFPRALHEVQYPARGDRELADAVAALLADRRAAVRDDWGLDHGAWSVLVHLRPRADVPVLQLSLDHCLPPAEHLAIGRALAALREQGVLLVGSGNVTHNLRHAIAHLGRRADTPAWAASFDAHVAAAVEQADGAALAAALGRDDGRLAHPTPDHYLPLLYAAGAGAGDPVSYPVLGWDAGSLSMRAIRWG